MKNTFSNKILPVFGLLLVSVSAFAQDATATAVKEPESFLEWMYHNMFVVLAVVAIIGAFGALMYMSRMLFQMQKMRLLQELGMEAMEEVKLLDEKPWYSRISDWAWKLKPMTQEKDIEFDHEYDGIRELDNVLPPWWVALFYGSIAFAVFYYGYYHFSDSNWSSAGQYEAEVEKMEEEVKVYLATQADQIDETNVTLLTDPDQLALGQSIFEANCVICHGAMGEGNQTGPNLTDKYWLHGGGVKNVFTTIKYGVPEKGMISWKAQLRAADMHRVASYILSLQGSNPPNAKDPQGELWKGEEEESGSESETTDEELSMQ